jgi:lipopolysaccharide export system protein LptA
MRRETIVRLTAVLSLLPAAAVAQITDLRLPISLDADSTAYDGKNSMLMFRGLRMTQGSIGIEAEEGRASNLNFEDSVWQFSGNVVIDVENGHIECDTADLQFTNHQLTLATIARQRGNDLRRSRQTSLRPARRHHRVLGKRRHHRRR